MVWYSLLKSFPQFVMIHTVKGFSVVVETEVDAFLKFPCFLYHPANVSNLISSSSSLSAIRVVSSSKSVDVSPASDFASLPFSRAYRLPRAKRCRTSLSGQMEIFVSQGVFLRRQV